MIRDVDLVSYFPPYLKEFKEMTVTLEAENPEFVLVWTAADRTLNNAFILTADEYGISRFEKMLKIFPSAEDTLESRRARVMARWFNNVPYTWRVFLEKLITLCGENNFTVTTDFLFYHIDLEVDLELFGQVEELEHMIETMVPCNMVFTSKNNIPCNAEGNAYVAGGICAVETFFITNDGKVTYTIHGMTLQGGGVVDAARYKITNDGREDISVSGEAFYGGGITDAVKVLITNDFNDSIKINGPAVTGADIEITEIVGANNL